MARPHQNSFPLEFSNCIIICVPSKQSNILCYVCTHTQFQLKHTYHVSSSLKFSCVSVLSQYLLLLPLLSFLFTVHSQSLCIIFLILLLAVLVSFVLPQYSPSKISGSLTQYQTPAILHYIQTSVLFPFKLLTLLTPVYTHFTAPRC